MKLFHKSQVILIGLTLGFFTQLASMGMMGIGAPSSVPSSSTQQSSSNLNNLGNQGSSGLMGIGASNSGPAASSSVQNPVSGTQTPSQQNTISGTTQTLTPGQQLFNQFYTTLQQYPTQLQNMFSYYKNVNSSQPNISLRAAFRGGSYPLQLLDSLRAIILQYIKGRTDQLDIHFYANDDANDFINFRAVEAKLEKTNTMGQLAQLDALWESVVQIFESEFAVIEGPTQSSNSSPSTIVSDLKNNYKAIVDAYTVQRNQIIVNWIYNLTNSLAQRYNEKNFTSGFYNFQIIPDGSALLVYQTVFDNALSALLNTNSVISIGNLKFSSTAKSAQTNSIQIGIIDETITTYNNQSDFQTAVQNTMTGQLATIGAYAGNVSFQKAVELSQNKIIPAEIKQLQFTYGKVTNAAVIMTYGAAQGEPTGAASQAALAVLDGDATNASSSEITSQASFEANVQAFFSTIAQIENIIAAFQFDQNTSSLWMPLEAQLTNVLSDAGTIKNDDPRKVQEEKFHIVVKATQQKTFKQAVAATKALVSGKDAFKEGKQQVMQALHQYKVSKNPSIASQIFMALTDAAWSYRLAAENYNTAGQTLWTQLYVGKATNIMQVLTSFQKAVEAFLQSAKAPQYLPKGSTETTQGTYYYQAQQAFNAAASALEALKSPELVTYVSQLAAYLGVIRYESVIGGYVNHYRQWIEPYIDGAVQVPSRGDLLNTMTVNINGQTETVYITSFQKALDMVFHYFNVLLPEIIKGYKEELTFYLSFSGKQDSYTNLVIDQLRSAITLFQNLQQAFSGIYHCIAASSETLPATTAQSQMKLYQSGPQEENGQLCDVITNSQNQLEKICWKCQPQKVLNNEFIACWASEQSGNCLGADNYISQIGQASDQSIIQWCIFANQRYFMAQPYFQKIDELFERYEQKVKLHDQFVTGLNAYTEVKQLLKIGQKTLQGLKSILEPGQTELTFQQFFFLHQARLYTTLGQQLQYGYWWNGTQYVKRNGGISAVCLYLYLWAKALYQQVGFTPQAEGVQEITDSIINQDQNLPAIFNQWGLESAKMAYQDTNLQEAKQYFEQAFAYLFTAYELEKDVTVKEQYSNNVLYLLSREIMNDAQIHAVKVPQKKSKIKNKQLQKQTKTITINKPVIDSYGSWLEQNANYLKYPNLDRVMVYYRAYLFALKARNNLSLKEEKAYQIFIQKVKTETNSNQSMTADFQTYNEAMFTEEYYERAAQLFFERAQQALDNTYEQFNTLNASSSLTEGQEFSAEEYQERVKKFNDVMSFQQLINVTQLHLELFTNFMGVNGILGRNGKSILQYLNWEKPQVNMNERLGDLYKESADIELQRQIQNFESGTSYGADTRSIFNDIIMRYQTAAEEYAQGDDQANLIEANLGITKAVAFQSFSSVIPVYTISTPDIALQSSGTNNNNGSSVPSLLQNQCGTALSLDDLVNNYDETIPFYLLNYKKVLISSTVAQKYKAQNLLKGQSKDLINIATAVYETVLNEQSQGTIDSTEYVALYKKQLSNLVTEGVTICGKTLKATLQLVEEIKTIRGQDFKSYYLEIFNGPLSATPRFSAELETALSLYSNGPLKLYGNGSAPISFGGQTLMQAQDQAGSTMVENAIIQTFYASIVSYRSKIQKTMQSAEYQAINWIDDPVFSSFTQADRTAAAEKIAQRTQTNPVINDKGIVWKTYTQLHIKLYNMFIDLLSTYGVLSQYLNTYNFNTGFLDKMQAEAYLNWMSVNSALLLGSPIESYFEGEVVLMEKHLNCVKQFVSFLNDTDGLPILEEAELIYIRSLALRGDALVLVDQTPQTTQYPTVSDIYPQPVQGFEDFKAWASAWNKYTVAIQQAQDFITSHPTSSSVNLVKDLLDITVTKSFLALARLATYYLARFGYNAYQQLMGVLTAEGMQKVAAKQWLDLVSSDDAYNYWELITTRKPNQSILSSIKQKMEASASGDGAQSDIQKQLAAHEWDDALYYRYPQIFSNNETQCSYASHSSVSSSNVVPFSFLPQSKTSLNYQGVASLKTPSFQYLLNNGLSDQAGTASFENYESGGTNFESYTDCSDKIITVNGNVGQAYSIMQNDLLKAIYYYMQAFNTLRVLSPKTPKLTLKSLKAQKKKKLNPGDILTTVKLALQLSKSPAFGLVIDENILKTPVISVSSTTKGAGKAVNRFLRISNYIQPGFILPGEKESPWDFLSVASDADIYIQTLCYWASQITFGPDIYNPLQEWLEYYQNKQVPQIDFSNLSASVQQKLPNQTPLQSDFLSAAFSWASQFQMAACRIYWEAYLPEVTSFSDAIEQIETAMETLENEQLSGSNQYV